MELSASSQVPQEGLEALLTSITRSKYQLIVHGVLQRELGRQGRIYSQMPPTIHLLCCFPLSLATECKYSAYVHPIYQLLYKTKYHESSSPHGAISALILMEEGRAYCFAKGKALHEDRSPGCILVIEMLLLFLLRHWIFIPVPPNYKP